MRRQLHRIIALIALIGCDDPTVTWSDVSYRPTDPKGTASLSYALPDSAGCEFTARPFSIGDKTHTVWWSIRRDSSGILKYSSRTGGGWEAAVTVDTTDRSRRGCDRPAPAIAVDSAGQIYIAYFMEPQPGAGIFFVHKMDSIGFHDPISIAYGKRPSAVSVSASADRVAVAFEEPNTARGQIWLALSQSMGHLFESRMPVSGVSEIASNPAVILRGTKLEVDWYELIQSDSSQKLRMAKRTGTWE